jgi:hypothetical protein
LMNSASPLLRTSAETGRADELLAMGSSPRVMTVTWQPAAEETCLCLIDADEGGAGRWHAT